MILPRLDTSTKAALLAAAVIGLRLAPALAQTPPVPDPNPRPAAAAPQAVKPPAQPKVPDGPEFCDVTVIDKETGKPIAGASIGFVVQRGTPEPTTDEDGLVRIDLKSLTGVRRRFVFFSVGAEGYVKQEYNFDNSEPWGHAIPERITVGLFPGSESIGGIVKDTEGRPIAGAEVEIHGRLAETRDTHEVTMIHATTDADGRWRTKSLRSMNSINFTISHPDHLGDTLSNSRDAWKTEAEKPRALDELRAGTRVDVMEDGVEIEGQVTDEGGTPIAGAVVQLSEARYRFFTRDTWTTDPNGHFRVPHARPGPTTLLAMAKGHAPGLQAVDAGPDMPPVEFRLGPGHLLEGRIVDPEGRPIEDAHIYALRWQEYTLSGFGFTSDAEGRFRWEEAPADAVSISIGKAGYLYKHADSVVPGEGEQTIVLAPEFQIWGNVWYGGNGDPLQWAYVTARPIVPGSDPSAWQKCDGRVFEGELRLSLDRSASPAWQVRITCIGTEPFESNFLASDSGPLRLNVTMEPADGLTGCVFGPDNRPLAGAKVFILPLNSPPSLDLINPEGRADLPTVTTGPDGFFEFPVIEQPYRIVAEHEDYYGEVESADYIKDGIVRVAPWSRVEGVFKVGADPAPGEQILLRNVSSGLIPIISPIERLEATTDDDGRFVFEKVRPGDVQIGRWGGRRGVELSLDVGELFRVPPGETIDVQVGGRGRPLVGRFEAPDGVEDVPAFFGSLLLDLSSDLREIPVPTGSIRTVDGQTTPDLRQWVATWEASEDRLAYRRRLIHRSFMIRPDGSFRFEDVTAGAYRLSTFPRSASSRPPWAEAAADESSPRFMTTLVVPPSPDGQGNEPLDLGELQIWMQAPLLVGEPAPAIEGMTTAGDPIALADHLGKYVLLDFSAPGDNSSLMELIHLSKRQEDWAANDRLAVLSLTIAADTPEVRDSIVEKGQPWPQLIIGPLGPANHIAQAYDIGPAHLGRRGPTVAFLIGPDGTVLAKDLQVREIDEAIAKYLGP